jgi:signal transduction histidine kinase
MATRICTGGCRSDDEVAGLARTMNGMLARVEQATARQRQFVADASHELRTPLTRIRSALEVELAHPSADVDAVHRGLLADTVHLQDLVNDLLFLARSESGAVGGERRPVDLDDLVLDEARRLRARGRVQVSAVSAARTLGDARKLGRAVQNLGADAERHARRCVSFEVRECGGHSRLVVADDGDGIPPEHHATVFERFTRLDAARTRESGGAGLGLAIVRDIVTRHGGTIAVESAVGAGARFVMNLPRAD